MSVWRTGIIYLTVIYSAPSSALAADDIKNLMIWEILRTAPLHLGVGVYPDKNIWSPARLRALELLLNPSSEWSDMTRSLAQYIIPSLGFGATWSNNWSMSAAVCSVDAAC